MCCGIVIYSLLNVGGLNLRLSGAIRPLLWWYDDPNIMKLKKVKDTNEIFREVKK